MEDTALAVTNPAQSPANIPILRPIAPDLWVAECPLRFLGLELGARMTVVRFEDRLLLHAPIAASAGLQAQLAQLGTVQWAVAPNLYHHLFVGEWFGEGVEGWATERLQQKRADLAFTSTIGVDQPTWPAALEVYPLTSIPFSDEVVFFHRPSKTLILTDFVFHLTKAETPAFTRFMMFFGGAYPNVRCSHVERVMMDRKKGREDLGRLLEWDFDRLIMGHGQIVEEGGRAALKRAYKWLGAQAL